MNRTFLVGGILVVKSHGSEWFPFLRALRTLLIRSEIWRSLFLLIRICTCAYVRKIFVLATFTIGWTIRILCITCDYFCSCHIWSLIETKFLYLWIRNIWFLFSTTNYTCSLHLVSFILQSLSLWSFFGLLLAIQTCAAKLVSHVFSRLKLKFNIQLFK